MRAYIQRSIFNKAKFLVKQFRTSSQTPIAKDKIIMKDLSLSQAMAACRNINGN